MDTRPAVLALGVAFCGWVCTTPALGQQVVYVEPPAYEPHTHTGGFFGRIQLGFAYSYSSYETESLTWEGGAFDFSASLGLSLPVGIALHVDLLSDVAWEPRVTYMGTSSGSLTNTEYSTTGIGLGITHYFPGNGFVTGGFGYARANLRDRSGYEAQSDLGGYVTIGGGLEWWIAPRLGAGLFGRFTVYRLPDVSVDSSFTTVVPSVGFSMTVD